MTDVLFPKGRFVPVESLDSIAWAPLTQYSGILPLDLVPLSDTELLNAAHYALLGVHAVLLDLGPGQRLLRVLDIGLILTGIATVIYGISLLRTILAT